MKEKDIEQDAEAVYYIPAEGKDAIRVSGHIPRPNGIIGSHTRIKSNF